ncbi:MAG: tail fiber protein [Candidatus Brocadiaceae bacterium]
MKRSGIIVGIFLVVCFAFTCVQVQAADEGKKTPSHEQKKFSAKMQKKSTDSADSGVPQLINYQGNLTDSKGAPVTGQHKLTFRIYTDAIKTESQYLSWGPKTFPVVSFAEGSFNVILGNDDKGEAITEAFTSDKTFLEITIDNNDNPIKPRQQILSTPYALNGVPAGTINAFAGPVENIPPGWLLCNGTALKSQSYPSLFAAIGTAWGNGLNDADPDTNFNLPSLSGLFLRGVAYGSNQDPDRNDRAQIAVGGNTGDQVGSFQEGATKNPNTPFVTDSTGEHSHSLSGWMYKTEGVSSGYIGIIRNYAGNDIQTTAGGAHSHKIATGGDAETRPKNAYVNWIIKY